MNITGFEELYIAELQEACSFEALLVDALPDFADAATDARLRSAFKVHLTRTREQERAVDGLAAQHGVSPDARVDQSMQALIEQSFRMAAIVEPGPLRDAALVASARRIGNYQMALYGPLAGYARLLGRDADETVLRNILSEEKETDAALADLALGGVAPSPLEVAGSA